ncbi:MAG: LPS assembly lipoprotein LptE [Mangrovibacterium sp.]
MKVYLHKLALLAIMAQLIFLPFSACKMSYSFTGAALDPSVKTFAVLYIQNRARLVNPNLSQQLTDGLIDKINRQTSLQMMQNEGDLEFEGVISDYRVTPVNISQGDLAAQNRLTVTLQMKYTNNKDHDADWEKSFSAYVDFDANRLLSDVEESLAEEIIAQLTDDIFNASIANW